MSRADDFFRHLLRRKKLGLNKNNIVTSKYQQTTVNTLTSKVKIEKENDVYKIKGEKVKTIEESKIDIIKENDLIEIIEDEDVILKSRVELKVIEQLEEAINNNKKFDIKIEDINEKKIKTELSKLIKKDKENLNKINKEFENIEKETTIYKSKESIKELEKKIEVVKQKTNEIKKHYQIISEYYDFKGYSNLKNTILINSIEDYTFYKNTTDVDKLVNECKKECKKLDTIIEITNKCIESDKKILEVKNYNEKMNEKYNESKEKIDLVSNSYEKIDKNIKEQDDFLLRLESDIQTLDEKFNNMAYFDGTTSLINNLIKMGLNTYLIPLFPPIGLIIQALLLEKSIEGIRRLFNPDIKKTFVSQKVISKYINIIYDNKNTMDLMEQFLSKNINNIKDLKSEYINQFEKHKDILNDYEENIKKIDDIINKLEEKNKRVKLMKEELKQKKEKVLSLKN